MFRLVVASFGNLLTHEFEPAFPKRDRTGLEPRKSILYSALRFRGKESIVTKRVAIGELSSEFELWRPKELTLGIERSMVERFSFLGKKPQGFASFSSSGPITHCDLCSKRDFWSASATFKVALESAKNRARTLCVRGASELTHSFCLEPERYNANTSGFFERFNPCLLHVNNRKSKDLAMPDDISDPILAISFDDCTVAGSFV